MGTALRFISRCPFRLRHLAAGLLLVATLCVLASCSARSWEAVLVLADIDAGAGPSRLKNVTPEPLRQELTLTIGGRSYLVDLYQSQETTEAGLLLVPGAAETGKDDPRLRAFATSLARARFAVLVPDLPSLKSLKVNSGNIREVKDLFEYLASRSELSPGGRAGIFAFSYAAGPALHVALDPDTGRRVRFVFAVGPYHSLDRVLTFFTTGYFHEKGTLRHREPNAYGKWVFVLSNVDRLRSVNDRRLLSAMAERKKEDLDASLDDLAGQLAAEGRQVYAFISNRDPRRVEALKQGLPPSILEDLRRLDLADRDLSSLAAQLILVHGTDDDIIPYTESVALASEAPAERTDLYLIDSLAHVDLTPGLISRVRLWRAIESLLEEREKSIDP